MVKLKIIFFIFFSVLANLLFSQDPADLKWWAEAHNWDGKTHWSRYIIRMPGYMGPNALPIPMVKNAVISPEIKLETAAEYHAGTEELTVNPYLNLSLPVAGEKVALDFIYRPFEYYETSEAIGLERFVRYRACKGISKGDLYIGTLVHVLNQDKHFVDGNLEIYLKTTTGKDLANARYIDAPGYYFDLNLGKTLLKGDGVFKQLSVYSMGGFYAWQSDLDNNRQDDAYLYGVRSDVDFKPFSLSLSYSGYSGYMMMRDRPMAVRVTLTKNFKNSYFYLSCQQGLRDIIRSSFRFGFNYGFSKKNKKHEPSV